MPFPINEIETPPWRGYRIQLVNTKPAYTPIFPIVIVLSRRTIRSNFSAQPSAVSAALIPEAVRSVVFQGNSTEPM